MANILYLVHRLPYPPNKGDKVRSYHLLRHLLQRHRVFLGTFIDDPEDEQYLPLLRGLCPDLHVERIDPKSARVRSLSGLLSGEALTLTYYRNAGMQRWVKEIADTCRLQASVVFSSSMAQYAEPLSPEVPMLVDFVDLDSAKWTQYAPAHRWPLSWLYRREGEQLLGYERAVAAKSRRSFFVTPKETELFLSKAPECTEKVQPLSNGVDAEFFAPLSVRPNPFSVAEQAIVFTGAMDYWPNIDAVRWFVSEMLPMLLVHWPRVRFHIVGRNPTPEVHALASDRVVVTGTVPDVRPYLQHAAAVVAPLRVARGLQNKILEAMAMEQPVVTVGSCAEAIGATPEQGLLRADTPDEYLTALQRLLDHPRDVRGLKREARRFVMQRFSWQAHLSGIDACLSSSRPLPTLEAVHV
jgi:polysaccharide biosynthesis protein PslH